MNAYRPTDRSDDHHPQSPAHNSNQPNTRGETWAQPAPPLRVSRGRLEEIRAGLTPTDEGIVDTLGRVRVATSRQLQLLHVTEGSPLANARRARRRLERLATERVIVRMPRRVGGLYGGSAGAVYALDTAGQRLLTGAHSGARKPWVPRLGHLRHSLAITETYVELRHAERTGLVRLDEWHGEPGAWRQSNGAWGAATIKPDAFVRLTVAGDELSAFLEVDYATESLPVILRKADAYWRYYRSGVEQSRHDYFPEVLWLVPDLARLDRLVAAFASLPPEQWQLHRVAEQSEFIRTLLALPP